MYEPHQDTPNEKHTFPEPNTYDYASQLMFDANAFAAMSNQVDLNSATYMDFFRQGGDPYEMMRYQAAMQQSHDYASSCSSNNTTPPTSYNHLHQQQQQHHHSQLATHYPSTNSTSASLPPYQQNTYPMMAFHHHQDNPMGIPLERASMNYPIPYEHAAYMMNSGGPMPTLSTSSSSSSSLSSNTAAYGIASTSNNDNRAAQVYVRKACVSCKQSHVACDVQRPCARCVRLNKADTCVDAERKKRGRPCGSSKKKKESLLLQQQQQQQQQQQHHHQQQQSMTAAAASFNHLL